ncbi:hypothetical protein SLS62_007996 [Diatrype stigma]|uniref:Uncharacterized protein n=1 Tax=Diatrype stigma TaxID=117547 RepID=A0AAN9UYG7_9PEZI
MRNLLRLPLQMQNDKGEPNSSPKCTWVDKNHHNDFKAAAIGINWNQLQPPSGGAPDMETVKTHCGVDMQAWHEDGGPQILPAARRKRDVGRQSQRSDDRLIVSTLNNHNATELCQSESSWGPDFVSKVDGMYCNMDTHETIPLCDKTIEHDCFDLNNAAGPATVRRNGKRSLRNPSRVITWE